jgi:DNA-binding MarR family transcriptional regulator
MHSGRKPVELSPAGVLLPISRHGAVIEISAREWRQDLLLSWLFQASIRVQSSLNRVFSRLGMTLQEACVLLRCIEAKKIAPVRLALVVGRDRAKITRFLRRLEAAGLVRRSSDPHDSRRFKVQATSEGRRIGEEVALVFRKIRRELFSGLSDRDIEQLGEMLPHLHKNAKSLGCGRLATGPRVHRRIGSRQIKSRILGESDVPLMRVPIVQDAANSEFARLD